MTKRTTYIFFLFCFFTTSVLFNNCTPVSTSSSSSNNNSVLGNGGPYGGMVAKVYRYYDLSAPCSGLDLNGKPLANNAIIVTQGASSLDATLARTNCKDQAVPPVIPSSQITTTGTNTISYQNHSFTVVNPPKEFDVVMPACPAGKTPIVNPAPVNMASSPLDWNGPGWITHTGAQTSLYTTLQGLPAFLLERTISTTDDYIGSQQDPTLSPNTQYVFSFFARSGSVQQIDYNFLNALAHDPAGGSPQDESTEVTFDLSNQTTQIGYVQHLLNVQATVVPLGDGFICSVYFTTTNASYDPNWVSHVVSPSIFGPTGGAAGGSVIVTAAELLPVNQICK